MISRIKKILRKIALSREEKAVLNGLTNEDRKLISKIRSRKLTYLSTKKLDLLANTCHSIEETGLDGIYLEAGCALGGSSILIASLKSPKRPLFVYDVFGIIPPPTKEDTHDVHDRYRAIIEGKSKGIDGDKYYGYIKNLYDVVIANFQEFGIDREKQAVTLVKGLIQNTMTINRPVALAHIDVDWYEPVKICLKRIFPNLVVGGSIILDDYHDWGGCRKATDEYLREVVGQFVLDDSAGSLKITKQ